MKRLLLAIAGWMCLAVPAFAQGPQINTTTGIWGVNTSNNQPCVIGILPYVSTCQIPTSGGGGGGGNVTITGPLGVQSVADSIAVNLNGPTGAQTPANGISVTLDTTNSSYLSTIATNSALGAGAFGASGNPTSGLAFGGKNSSVSTTFNEAVFDNSTGALDVLDQSTGATGSIAPSDATLAGAKSSGNLVGIIQGDTTITWPSITTATTTQLVAGVSGKKTYVTHLMFGASAADTVTLEYSANSACSSANTIIWGPFSFAANGGSTEGGGLGPILVVPSADYLCVVTTTTATLGGALTHTQF